MQSFEVVVLISAGTEWRAVRVLHPDCEVNNSPYGEWFTLAVPVNGGCVDVCFMHGGYGKVAAAASAQYAIDIWSPKLVVNMGTCGGFEGRINVNTVILVNKTVVYDIEDQMGDQSVSIAHYTTELDYSWLKKPYPYPVHEGLLLSGDRDLVPDQVEELHQTYGAIAGDWESAAIAYVASHNAVRCLILRMVSDLVSKEGGEVYDAGIDLFRERACYAMGYLISSLSDWLKCVGY